MKRDLARWRMTQLRGAKAYAETLAGRARKPVARESARRRGERAQRAKILAERVHGKPCAVVWDEHCTGKATDGHEVMTRARHPGAHLVAGNVIPVCRPCHTAITEHPAEAHERGWMRHSWEGLP